MPGAKVQLPTRSAPLVSRDAGKNESRMSRPRSTTTRVFEAWCSKQPIGHRIQRTAGSLLGQVACRKGIDHVQAGQIGQSTGVDHRQIADQSASASSPDAWLRDADRQQTPIELRPGGSTGRRQPLPRIRPARRPARRRCSPVQRRGRPIARRSRRGKSRVACPTISTRDSSAWPAQATSTARTCRDEREKASPTTNRQRSIPGRAKSDGCARRHRASVSSPLACARCSRGGQTTRRLAACVALRFSRHLMVIGNRAGRTMVLAGPRPGRGGRSRCCQIGTNAAVRQTARRIEGIVVLFARCLLGNGLATISRRAGTILAS